MKSIWLVARQAPAFIQGSGSHGFTSTTNTSKTQSMVLPDASENVIRTSVVPVRKKKPDWGDSLVITAVPETSIAVGVGHDTMAPPALTRVVLTMLLGHCKITGGVVSTGVTTTLNPTVSWFPDGSSKT